MNSDAHTADHGRAGLSEDEIRRIEDGLGDTDVHTAPLDLIVAVEAILAARMADAYEQGWREGWCDDHEGIAPKEAMEACATAWDEGHDAMCESSMCFCLNPYRRQP